MEHNRFTPQHWYSDKKTSFLQKITNYLITPQCRLSYEYRLWIETSFNKLIDVMGLDFLQQRRVITPTSKDFPIKRDLSPDALALATLECVCSYLDIDSSKINLGFFDNGSTHYTSPALHAQTSKGAAGYFEGVDEKGIVYISLSEDLISDPIRIVSVLVHELSHYILFRDTIVTGEEEDHEELTDLFTIFLGFGIFTANGCFKVEHQDMGLSSSWSSSNIGYLNEPGIAYALAIFSYLRNEEFPSWHHYLNSSVKRYFKENYLFLYNDENHTIKAT